MKKMAKKHQAVLIVLDGWGYREELKDNAVKAAKTPFFDHIWKQYPHSLLEASGLAVGLPEGQMGNSEIGHTTIGAGTIIDTDLVRIKKAIDSGEFDTNPAFKSLFAHVKKYDSTLHVQGLVSTGGVHSHQEHLFAFLRAAKKAGIQKVAIHVFTDGRDTAPQSAAGFIRDLEKVIKEVGVGAIATLSGRFYAMDRDNNWDRLAKVEAALFEAKGHVSMARPSVHLENLYKEGKLDEHIEPIVFTDQKRSWPIQKNDAVLFFNFRSDRARMLSTKMLEKQKTLNILFATMTEYSSEFKCLVAYPAFSIKTTLAAEIAKAGMSQAHIAETEKFPHATYFLNGGREKPHKKETHIMLDSRKDVPTHDLAPKMRAEGIADKAIEQINAGTNFLFINFANPDMVGHTANVPAIIEAVEEVDAQLKRVLLAMEAHAQKTGTTATAFVTADHGNAELNIDPDTGKKHTAHTINPVPAVLVSYQKTELKKHVPVKKSPVVRLKNGTLADITPTLFSLLGIKKPSTMSGKSLIKK